MQNALVKTFFAFFIALAPLCGEEQAIGSAGKPAATVAQTKVPRTFAAINARFAPLDDYLQIISASPVPNEKTQGTDYLLSLQGKSSQIDVLLAAQGLKKNGAVVSTDAQGKTKITPSQGSSGTVPIAPVMAILGITLPQGDPFDTIRQSVLQVSSIDLDITANLQLRCNGSIVSPSSSIPFSLLILPQEKQFAFAINLSQSGSFSINNTMPQLTALNAQLSITPLSVVISTMAVQDPWLLAAAGFTANQKIKPLATGSTLMWKVQSKPDTAAGSLLADFGIPQALMLFNAPASINLKNLTSADFKKLIFTILPIAEPVNGLCPAGGLAPLLTKMGLQQLSSTAAKSLGTICFERPDIILNFEKGLDKPIFVLGGALKSGGKAAEIKADASQRGLALGWESSVEKNITLSSLHPALASYDKYFALNDVVLGFTNKIGTSIFDTHDGLIDPKTPGALLIRKGMTIIGTLAGATQPVQNALRLLHVEKPRLAIWIPANMKSPKDIKLKLISRQQSTTTVTVGALVQELGLTMPSGAFFNQLAQTGFTLFDIGLADTETDNPKVRALLNLMIGQTRFQLYVLVSLKDKKQATVAIKPQGISSFTLGSLNQKLSIIDQQVRLIDNTIVISAVESDDAALLKFAATTPEDIKIIKRHTETILPQPKPQETEQPTAPTEEPTETADDADLAALLGEDPDTETKGAAPETAASEGDTGDANTQESEEDDAELAALLGEEADTTPTAAPAESGAPAASGPRTITVEEITTLKAHKAAAVKKINPGVTVISDFTAVANSLFANSLQDIGIQSARTILYVPKDLDLKKITTKEELKRIALSIIPLQKPAEGLCLLGALDKPLRAGGADSAADQIKEITQPFCFGTEIVIDIAESEIDIGGPLKSGGDKAQINFNFGEGKKITAAWEGDAPSLTGVQPSGNAAASQSASIALQALAVVHEVGTFKKTGVIVSTQDTAMVYDLHDGMKDPETPGSLKVTKGITLYGDLDLSKGRHQNVMTLLGTSMVHYKAHMPLAPKGIRDVSFELVAADNKPMTLCINKLLQQAGITVPTIPLLSGALNDCARIQSLTFGYDSQNRLVFTINAQTVIAGANVLIQTTIPFDQQDEIVVAMSSAAPLQLPAQQLPGPLNDVINQFTLQNGVLYIALKDTNNQDALQNGLKAAGITAPAPITVKQLTQGYTFVADAIPTNKLNDFAKQLLVNKVRVIAQTPFTTASINDLRIQFATAAAPTADKQQQLCLGNLLKEVLAQIPDNPLTQALKTTCMNVQNAVVQFINGNFEIDYQGSMTIGGTAGQVTVHTRIVGNDTEYTVTAKVPQGLAMKTIDPSLSSIDDALKLSNVAIKVSNSKEETSAVSIEGEAESRAFLSAIAQEQLKIPGFKFVYQLKRGAQSWRDDATIRLTPLNQSDSQFCTAAPVSLVTEHLKMQAAELLQKLFVTVCFKNPVFGLSLDQKNLDFFIYGQATAGAMNGDAIIQVGQGIEETEYRFTMGLRHIDELRFADIDPSLAAIDEQLTLSNVRMALTNVKDASVFTEKQGAEAASAGHAIVHLEPGITIVSSVKLKGDVGAISGFVNIKKLRCTIFIPKGAKSSKDIQVRIEEEETADKAETICLDGVLAPIPGYTPLSKLLGVSKLCVTKKSLVIIPATDGLILTILGSIDTGGTSADATIVVNTKKSESSIALVINGHKNFDLTKISSNLAPLVAITAVKDPVFMLSTGKTGIDLPGIGSIEPGLTVKGICHFGSFYGTILDAFSANDLLVTVTIPSDPANLNGYIFKATKQIDRTVSSLKLQYINLILRGGTPPELELDIDADLTLPGNNQIYRTKLSASIKDIGWTLNGALACSPTGCPTFAVPLGIPIKLAATPEVPLSVLLNFAGGVTEGFGGSGLLTVNNKSLLTAFDIKAAHPDQNAVMVKSDPAKKDKWYPSDLMALFSIFTQQLPFKTLGLADFFYLTNLGLSAAKTETEISGFTVPKGLDVSGKLVIDPLGLQGQLKLHVKTPDLVSVLTAADSIGVIGEGSVSAIDLGPAFKMTSTDGKTGPTISVALTKNKQEFVLDGQISVLNGLLNNHGQVTFTPAGMNAQLDGSVAGLAGKFQLNAAVQDFINKDFDHIGFTGTISQDFTSTVNDALAASMKDILSGVGTASAQLTAICQKMAGLMSVVNIDCRQCLASLAAPLTVSDAVIQAALKAANITINKIELDSTLGNMIRGQSAQLFITLTVFGRSLKVGPIGIDVHKPAGPLTAAIGAALKAVLTPADIIKSLSQSIVAAIPTQAICNAGITLGASKLQGQVTIDTAHPNKSSISATFNQLSLADLMSLASKGLNIAIPANAVPPLGITNGTLAMSAQSASVNGSLSVLGLGAGTVHGSIDGTGCSLSGALTGLSIPHVLSFADGAALTLVLNDKQQQISVAGGLTLFDLLSGKGTITISATPTISLDTSFLGIGAQATITGFTADHFDPSAANLKIVLTNDLSTAVADALKNLISPYQNTSSQIAGNASSVVGQIADTCNQIPVAANIVCSPINDARDLLSKINAINNQLANMVNQIAQQCTIKSLKFDGQLNAFKVQSGKLVIPTINAVITLMGRDVNLTLHNVAPSSVGDLVQAIAQAAFASMGPDQMVQQIQNQLKQLNHLLDNAAKLLADALKNALLNLGKMLGDEAQKIGEQAAGVAVEAGKQAAQAAQEAAQKAEEAAKQAAKAAQEAAKAAEQAAEDAAKAAEQAAQQAMQAAKAAVEAAKKAAEDAARAAEKAAEDAARAIANAGRSIGHALHKF